MSRPAPAQPPPAPIRPGYDSLGPTTYYATHGHNYANPHEGLIRRLVDSWIDRHQPPADSRILDLACGSGEITMIFRERGISQVTGIDPYTGQAYMARTGLEALPHNFVSVSRGTIDELRFDFVFCSFALHLAEPGLLPQVCQRLAGIAPALVILTPHKRPEIKPAWGWQLAEEVLENRVRLRHYERS